MPTTSNPVLKMLKADHKKVKALFAEYEEATPRKKQDIAQTTIQELEIHAGLEEKLIYPAIREGIDDNEVMNEAMEEHHLVHVLIAELKELEPSDDTFRAKFILLGERQASRERRRGRDVSTGGEGQDRLGDARSGGHEAQGTTHGGLVPL